MRWKIMAFVGLLFGVAGIVWGSAQRNPVGFFELRVYTAKPGKRDALAARFANRTAAIYARHGITNGLAPVLLEALYLLRIWSAVA